MFFLLKQKKQPLKTALYTFFRVGESIVALKNSQWKTEEISTLLVSGKIFKAYADIVCLVEIVDNGILEKRGSLVVNDQHISVPDSSVRLLIKEKRPMAIDVRVGEEKRSAIAEIKGNTISLIFL